MLSCPHSSGDYDYFRCPPTFPRPVGNQPPSHGADPRNRCQNFNELGHVHQYCPWRVHQGYPLPLGTTPSRPADTVPGGRFASQLTLNCSHPWQHSFIQANIAVSAAAGAGYEHAFLAHGLDPTNDEATETGYDEHDHYCFQTNPYYDLSYHASQDQDYAFTPQPLDHE